MSHAVVSTLQYRLTAADGLTVITLNHQALGLIQDGAREGLSHGWTPLLERVRTHAESV